jgi:P-type Cu+ transporter
LDFEKMSESCYHCGTECPKRPIVFDEKPFCCSGCKTVYSILSENGMTGYYELNNAPGKRPEASDSKYAFLDNEIIAKDLISFQEGRLTGMHTFMPNMHCSSCIWLLENLHKLEPGVKSSQVNFSKREAYIVFEHETISIRRMAEFLDALGYPPVIGKQAENSKKIINKRFIVQLGVAFFCFGNIMLFSFPEYFTVDETYNEFRNFFAYLIFAFSIPILLFSARDYLISAYKALRTKVLNLDVPISLGILVLYAKSTADIFMGEGPGYMDSFAGFILFLLLGKWFQHRTHDAMSFERDYKSYFPLAVKRINGEKEEIVQIENIIPDDKLLIHNGEILPTDAVLYSDMAQVDYSFVTGESDLISKKKGDLLYAGGKLSGRAVEVVVKSAVKRSYLTSLWNNQVFEKEKSGLSKIQDTLSRYFLIGLLIVTTLIGGFWLYFDASMFIPVVTAVLIVACPCALSISYPFTFGMILRSIGRNGLYLKNTRVIEELDEITDIAFDKTGTLTTGSSKDVNYGGEELSIEQIQFLDAATKSSTHPMSVNIRAFLQDNYDIPEAKALQFEEQQGLGLVVSDGTNELKLGSYRFLGVDKIDDETSSFVSWNGQVLGRFFVKQHFRKGIENLVQDLQNQGYRLHVITGDNERAREDLEQIFQGRAVLNFHQSPNDKLEYIEKLQKSGGKVLMFGDGLNDAGALQQSNVGISVSDNVYQFSPACDGILDAGHFKDIPRIMTLSKYGKKALRVNFMFSLLYNVVGLSIAASGLMSPIVAAILMPLSSVTVAVLSFTQVNFKSKKLGLLRAQL